MWVSLPVRLGTKPSSKSKLSELERRDSWRIQGISVSLLGAQVPDTGSPAPGRAGG